MKRSLLKLRQTQTGKSCAINRGILGQIDLDLKQRLRAILIALFTILVVGSVGYSILEDWSLFDGLWMTVITLSTIGYGEVHHLTTAGRVFTIFLTVGGLGFMAYSFSALTAFIVEGELRDVLRRRKMQSRIEALENHYIVCGAGFTGTAIIEELVKIQRPFVAIDQDHHKCQVVQEMGYPFIEGDALEDATLEAAGVRHARGIFCAIESDRDNVFICLTARGLNPDLRIVSEAHDERVRKKLIRSGADAVVNSDRIGGLRIASEMVRPATVGFLDAMIRDETATYRFEEVRIPDGSNLVNKPVGSINDVAGKKPLVVAIKDSETGLYTVNPPSNKLINAGNLLIVIGSMEEVSQLQKIAGAQS